MNILHLEKGNNPQIIKRALEVLKSGGLVVAPSDTVYGVLVDAASETAVKKLIEFKNRPIGKSISVFVSDLRMAKNYVVVNTKQETTLKALLPGPFTIVLPSKHRTSSLLDSEKGTLGIRIPDYSLITDLIKQFNKPTTATSANLAGRSPHYSIESLLKELPASKKILIDLVIDDGKLPRNKPSTVMDLTTPQLKIIRQGDIVFNAEKNYLTTSPTQTKKIARHVFSKTLKADKPTVYILQGELGVGKTIFVKGIAERLGINNIISPTFTVYYEYDIVGHTFLKNLYHVDLYNIEDPEEFKHLGIEDILKKNSIMFIEWGEKSGEILSTLKKKAHIIFIKLIYLDEHKREIQI